MEIIHKINWVDVFVVIIVLRTTYVAAKDGFSHEIFPLIGIFLVTVFSLHYYQVIGGALRTRFQIIPESIADFVCFLGISVISIIIVRILKVLLDKIVKVQWHSGLEKGGGVICGLARSLMTASIILLALNMMPLSYFDRSINEKSLIGKKVMGIGPAIYGKVAHMLPAK